MSELNGLEIALIGIGCSFPKSSDTKKYWELLESGECGISFFSDSELLAANIPLSEINKPNYVKAKGIIEGIEYFDADFFGYTANEANYLNPQHRIILECAYNALLDGGYSENRNNIPIGVYVASDTNTYLFDSMKEASTKEDPANIMLLNAKDYLATTISYKLNLYGQSMSVQCGCSSSLVAIHLACQALLSGDVEMALAGGVAIHLPNKNGYVYTPEGRFSPDGTVRALSQEASGVVISDGAGVVLLKRYEDALRDQDPIYCVIKSSYVNNDGMRKQNFSAPSEEGEYEAITKAFEIAEVNPSTVSYVEAHGTGTLIGDTVELAAWTRCFKKYSNLNKYCAIGTVDNNIGHVTVASGVAKLIKVALMLQKKKIVKNLNTLHPNQSINLETSPFYICNEEKDWNVINGVRRAAVGSFGIGGTNTVFVLEEASLCKNKSVDEYMIMPLSAHSSWAMKELKCNLSEELSKKKNLTEVFDISSTYAREAKVFKMRDYCVYNRKEKLLDWLESKVEDNDFKDLSKHSVVFLFSGQGNQYAELGRDLYNNLPIFHNYFDECLSILRDNHDFEYFSYNNEGIELYNDFLYSQISIFIYQYSMYKTLEEFGLKPSFLIGHSLGEYVSACVSDVFSLKDAIYLVYNRAKLIEGTRDGDMMVVCKNEKDIQPYLSEDVSIAAINDRFSVSVSGTEEAVRNLKRKLESEAVACIGIGTKKALHSPIMLDIAEKYRKVLETIKFHIPTKNCVSTVEPGISKKKISCPEYWINNLCMPVRFYDGIQLIKEKNKNCVYLELGPGNALFSLIKTIDRKAVCYPVLQSELATKGVQNIFNKKIIGEYQAFLNTIGLLWKGNIISDISVLYYGKKTGKAPMLPYPYDRKKYWHNIYSNKNQILEKVMPSSENEKMIASIWEEILKHQDFGIEDYFFNVGGNSLKIVKMQVMLEKMGIEIELNTLYNLKTIKEQVAYIEGRQRKFDVHDEHLVKEEDYLPTNKQYSKYEGFNEFVYKNCFFNQLLCVLKANNVNPMVIFSNDILLYRLEEEIKVHYQENDVEKALKETGIKVFKEQKVKHIEERIKKAVQEGRSVILSIDCFMEESRAETYMKEHVSTMLVVYGYDEGVDCFITVERKYFDTLSYQVRKMKVSELVECYEEYVRYYQTSDVVSNPSYFELDVSELNENINSMEMMENYINNFKVNEEMIRNSLLNIIQFRNVFEEMIEGKSMTRTRAEKLIVSINDIVNGKKVQKFKLLNKVLFENDEVVLNTFVEIISKWEHIRNVLVKYTCTEMYSKSIKKIPDILTEIYNKELELVNYIANDFEVRKKK